MTTPQPGPGSASAWGDASLLLAPRRAEFDVPRALVWLNCAQMSISHESVLAAGLEGVRLKRAPWTLPPKRFFSEIEVARGLFADLIGATADDVALVPSASYGLAVAACNVDVPEGGEIVMLEEQFPSNVYVWRRRADEAGGRVVTARRRADGDATEPLLEAISERTAVVACGVVHWSDGTAIDWPRVAARARAVGAAVVLDGCQAIGAAPFDLAAVDPDFMACPMYKWMLGPYATGFLYVAPRRQAGRPLEETWMNRDNAERFAELVRYSDGYAPGARRYDMGEKAQFHVAPMMVAALRLLTDWGVARIARSLDAINRRLIDGLVARGFEAPAEAIRSPHYFGVRLPTRAPADLAARLAEDAVYVSVRGDKMRIAPHLWIDEEDEERFFRVLDSRLG